MAKLKINQAKPLEFGIYSLGDNMPNPHTNTLISNEERIKNIMELATFAEEAGLDVFALGESHQQHFTSQAHTVILGAIAASTKHIKISSSSSIISTADPVRVYEDFTTIDLISQGRAEIVGGRASRIGLFELLGYDLKDYEALFEEKFELLLQLNREKIINWSGDFRAPLNNIEIFPQPIDEWLPIWRAVGGGMGSAVKAGRQGVPMSIATLAGPSAAFNSSINAYRSSAIDAGFDPAPKKMPVAIAGLMYLADDQMTAMKEFYPYIDNGMRRSNGTGFPKQAMISQSDIRQTMMVGTPRQIVEKILYQHEQFNHQRYMAQIDFAGIPHEQSMKTIELLGETVIPEVTKHLGGKI